MAQLAARFEEAALRLGVVEGATLVLGVSGGADSTALMHLAVRTAPAHRWEPSVAHLDHALRPDSSEDARFVADAATALGLPVTIRRTDVAALAAERGDGIEEAGRIARYAFLEWLAEAAGPDGVVMTAHTADDQAETVLLHIARGTGLAGLAGIAERRGRIVRPLLGERGATLRAAIEACGIAYRDDPSNAQGRFARNRARTDLLPGLERVHPGVVQALSRLAALAASDERLLDALALTELAARRAADGLIDWRPEPPRAIAARLVREAIGPPAPSAERTGAVVAAANAGRGARIIELGGQRRAVVRSRRVRILRAG